MMKNTHLIRTFTIYSLIAFALMGTVLSFVIYKHIKDDKLANIEEAAQVTVKAVINNNLQRSDFSTQITSTKSAQIRSSVIEALSLYDIESITFVNKNKEVIMSENSDFAGDQVQDSNYLDKVLNAEVSFAFSDSYKSTMGISGTINGKSFDMNRIDEEVNLNESEIWIIRNSGGMMQTGGHPLHVHGTQFQVISRNGKTLPLQERGFKDTVFVNIGEEVVIRVRFTHPGIFMYHCHILEHEDSGMMGQFRVS